MKGYTGFIPPMSIVSRIKGFFGNGLPSRIKLGTKPVGVGYPVFVIAEIGINHNGDVGIAKRLIDAAAEAGADAVKFQKRDTKEVLTKEGREKPYTSPHAFAPTYGEHRDKLEFGEMEYKELKRYAAEKGLLFFASVWDTKSTDFMREIGVDAYKIPSADLMSLPILEYVARQNKPVLLSTGMSTEEEIDTAVHTILQHNNRLILFHCLSLYPSPEHMLNVRYMDVLRDTYAPLPVGYSGHERDLLPTLVAVSRGAVIVERHLTLDKDMKGSDHAGSLEPHELKDLVTQIRRIERIFGTSEKIMYDELLPLREKLAKSVTTTRPIRKGERITRDMLTVKSPGNGISAAKIRDVIGRIAQVDIGQDELLPLNALSWPSA
ncbi:MAG: N-acetylneuraminate synthase family protein [Patescibacteria group bacterium]|nr:N-acetylneuraminate synthase family protein [Patescibacteria group bacterium]